LYSSDGKLSLLGAILELKMHKKCFGPHCKTYSAPQGKKTGREGWENKEKRGKSKNKEKKERGRRREKGEERRDESISRIFIYKQWQLWSLCRAYKG